MKNIILKLFITIICTVPLSGCYEVEKGEKVGEIIDINKSGLFYKTCECKIMRGGLQDGSGSLGNQVELTIEDKNLIEKAERLMLQKKIVSIKYHNELFTIFRSRFDSAGFVDSIDEIIKK